ncbi:hypothetical protein BDZ94DRAFT_571566 [Collybia nuda]|uniref:RlpA-like protein double-psi beta-barrel domain-containing protein n=1 Tax=Collybia nuda TaxID=64659 RepID=A0A9P5YGZ5_9AGAR|nr:hypothetical protein BDZ94DRAFT_571566 [Collybia nuda]
MFHKRIDQPVLLGVLFFFAFHVSAATNPITSNTISRSKYMRAHSLGENYSFDPRDGWQTVNTTNLEYKYRRNADFTELSLEHEKEGGNVGNGRDKKNKQIESKLGLGSLGGVIANVWAGLKGIGKSEAATITWYTGHDLKNPSCWANGNWAPTDQSFACALTLEGWHDRPQCFKFLELCNTPKKCVFVRVVDSCAGCAAGSRHVDLTKAAFKQLADLEQGKLTVQFRVATEPTGWFEDLWGPKQKH